MNRQSPPLSFHILKWVTVIVLIGICVKAGSILISLAVSLFINPVAAGKLYMGLDLSALFKYDRTQYLIVVGMLLGLTFLKLRLVYDLSTVFKVLDIERPFSQKVYVIIRRMASTALTAGILAVVASKYTQQLNKRGVVIPIEWAAEEILIFAASLMVISWVFKRGIEMEKEQSLTV